MTNRPITEEHIGQEVAIRQWGSYFDYGIVGAVSDKYVLLLASWRDDNPGKKYSYRVCQQQYYTFWKPYKTILPENIDQEQCKWLLEQEIERAEARRQAETHVLFNSIDDGFFF